jgi:hypothetical protein
MRQTLREVREHVCLSEKVGNLKVDQTSYLAALKSVVSPCFHINKDKILTSLVFTYPTMLGTMWLEGAVLMCLQIAIV